MAVIRGIITDIASTICDKGTVVPLIAMKKSWKDFGVDVSYEILNCGMGSSKADHIIITQRLLNTDKAYRVKLDKLMDRVEYNTVKILREEKSHSILFDDLADRFKELQSQGYKIGHTTGYTNSMIQPILQHWKDIHKYIPDAIIPSDEVSKGRPYPDAIIQCSERMGVSLRNCINIDDSEVGIKAGNNANIPSFGVYQYGNWRGPFELQLKEEAIHDNTYYEKIYKGINEEYFKMRKLAKYVYPTTSHILQTMNQNFLINLNTKNNKIKMEIYRHINRYNCLVKYDIDGDVMIITIKNILTYQWGGDEEEDDFFVDPEGGPRIIKGYNFTVNSKKYIVDKLLKFEAIQNTNIDDPINSVIYYDLIIKCKYTAVNC